jgi:hypothetical protein
MADCASFGFLPMGQFFSGAAGIAGAAIQKLGEALKVPVNELLTLQPILAVRIAIASSWKTSTH